MRSTSLRALYSSLHQDVLQSLPDRGETRLTNLRFLMLGIFHARSVQLNPIACHLPVRAQKLSIRPINFDDPADKARHDRTVTLVKTMLTLKQHAAAPTDDQRHELQARINTTHQQIDALVYQLYGLTNDEIKIVEQR